MENALSFKDVFKKSVLEAGGYMQPLTLDSAIATLGCIGVSIVLGFVIYYVYKKTFRGVVFSQSFAITIVGMAVMTCGIIVTIQSNVVLSLGMVGALSIVRYRAAIKEPMDLFYLFWAVAIGIASGAGLFYVALVITAAITVILLLLGRTASKEEIYIMIIHYDAEDIGDQIRRILGTARYQIKSRTLRKDDAEMAVEVRVKNNNLAFSEQIQKLENVRDVTVVQYGGDYIG